MVVWAPDGNYRHHPDAVAPYRWSAELAAAHFETIGHVEVLLRNFISSRLEAASAPGTWFEGQNRYHFSGPAQKSIDKARRRLTGPVTSGRPVAEPTFDFWRFLLVKRHEGAIWRTLLPQGMPHYPAPRSRGAFEGHVDRIHRARNRIAHHEPLARADPDRENRDLDRLWDDLRTVGGWIDPDAPDWIMGKSRIHIVRPLRPGMMLRSGATPTREES
ncbi:hypothetical protein [Corynebacterium sphenisci]|uniref:hypothetical protein n=1 Tax=Corynebacterium sphenisci TaxID=191493 RepID=UPI0026DEB663|nr:hypothetical protein [Corynebacterium sphenisci]MDO5730396.1 hypothetical protein [Corynebacterium sphenisci]